MSATLQIIFITVVVEESGETKVFLEFSPPPEKSLYGAYLKGWGAIAKSSLSAG